MRPLMIISGFRFAWARPFFQGSVEARAADRPEGTGDISRVSSGHVLSETAGARVSLLGNAA